ncbi:MAG TPA: hypothetical protein VD948_04705 [Rhodothermales bacterium]|nr:hypothetical protein [Rhodothermales bacterium]
MRVLPLLGLLVLPIFGAACRSEAPPLPTAEAPAEPIRLTAAAMGQLRWLEGDWQGSGIDQPPFYEGYRFVNDSTIRSVTYRDSTRTQVADSGRVVLVDGVLTSGSSGTRWAATILDADRVHFAPQEGARNAFTWERTSDSTWTATLRWPGENGQPGRERVYYMVRMRP